MKVIIAFDFADLILVRIFLTSRLKTLFKIITLDSVLSFSMSKCNGDMSFGFADMWSLFWIVSALVPLIYYGYELILSILFFSQQLLPFKDILQPKSNPYLDFSLPPLCPC